MSQRRETSDSDVLERLNRVAQLLEEVGAGVLGQRIRRLRISQEISIRELAERAEISKNSIVRLEQGRGTQPLTILKVCSVFGIHIERLADQTGSAVMAMVHKNKDDRWFDQADMGSKPLLGSKGSLTSKQRKQSVDEGAGVPVNLLKSRLHNGKILPCVLEVYKKSGTRSHVGEEFAMILEGVAVITVGQKKHRLKAGESITFWSAEPHSYAPADSKRIPVRILCVRIDG